MNNFFFKSANFIFLCLFISISTASNDKSLNLFINGNWIGAGVAYGPFRDGQAPGGKSPSVEELTEDLHIISERWKWIRVYGSGRITSDILKIINKEQLDIKVMLGAWISKEENNPDAKGNNQKEIDEAIKLANNFPDIVNSINIGNETMIYWSDHRVDINTMLGYINYTSERTDVPVTTADDLGFWVSEESKLIAESCDFIVLHIHPLWGGKKIDQALNWVKEIYAQVKSLHPNKQIVIGETGWATTKHNEGLQHQLIKGLPNEENQMTYYNQFRNWAIEHKIPHHFFEVFDEKWKGGEHPNEVEKHWGLYYSNRKAKHVLRDEQDQ